MSSPKKIVKKTTTTETIRVQRSSFADQFFDARQSADLQIDIKEKALQIDHLRTTLINLNQKLVIQNDLKTDVQEHKDLLDEAQVSRDQLHVDIRAYTAQHDKESAAYRARQAELNTEVDTLNGVIEDERQRAARAKQAHLDECERLNKDHNNTKVAYQKEIVDLKDVQVKAKKFWDTQMHEQEQRHTKELTLRDEQLAKREQEHKDQLAYLIDAHEKLTAENRKRHEEQLQRRLDENHANERRFLAREAELTDELSAQEQRHLNEVDAMNKRHAALVAKMTSDFENMRTLKDKEIQELHTLNETQRAQFEQEQRRLQSTIHTQSTQINELTTTVTHLQSELTIRKDCEAELAVERASRNQIFAAKEELQKELDVAAEYINELEDKYLKAQETSIELLKTLKETEFELEAAHMEITTLKQYIIDLKSRIAVYIPVRGDPVDKRLAEYINNFPDRQKLKIMFMRESDGVYQFGTKRVSVKVEKDKINIRVGGGYLSIDEFLDQYTPVELEKLERKDPLKRFNEKIAVQKTIAGKELRESSPVRSSPRKGSPMKI